jgi:hypothetical protein
VEHFSRYGLLDLDDDEPGTAPPANGHGPGAAPRSVRPRAATSEAEGGDEAGGAPPRALGLLDNAGGAGLLAGRGLAAGGLRLGGDGARARAGGSRAEEGSAALPADSGQEASVGDRVRRRIYDPSAAGGGLGLMPEEASEEDGAVTSGLVGRGAGDCGGGGEGRG